ncbi:hypothetical protein [Streptomyces sp. NBC_01244]|uniref:hypothetical protein n=1 Tax=Streptomyces sp. NBC_01244 TaxID=2903797 RepID=UPI002E15B357|nr:hypothetical protein OG247_43780 [Streptomyces sp. NBC_01244]
MRTITSVHERPDVASDYRDAVLELLEEQRWLFVYEHRGQVFDGRPINTMRLVNYLAPDTGDDKWAVTYDDNMAHEVHEVDTFEEADALYDEYVAHLGQDDPDL